MCEFGHQPKWCRNIRIFINKYCMPKCIAYYSNCQPLCYRFCIPAAARPGWRRCHLQRSNIPTYFFLIHGANREARCKTLVPSLQVQRGNRAYLFNQTILDRHVAALLAMTRLSGPCWRITIAPATKKPAAPNTQVWPEM